MMTDGTVAADRSQETRFVPTRTRVVFLILAAALVLAGVGCWIESFCSGWQPSVAYWGTPMQTLPANDTATAWWLAGIVSISVGGGTGIISAAPKPLAAAAAIAVIYRAAAVLFLLLLAAIS